MLGCRCRTSSRYCSASSTFNSRWPACESGRGGPPPGALMVLTSCAGQRWAAVSIFKRSRIQGAREKGFQPMRAHHASSSIFAIARHLKIIVSNALMPSAELSMAAPDFRGLLLLNLSLLRSDDEGIVDRESCQIISHLQISGSNRSSKVTSKDSNARFFESSVRVRGRRSPCGATRSCATVETKSKEILIDRQPRIMNFFSSLHGTLLVGTTCSGTSL